jgi:hypothetical protein
MIQPSIYIVAVFHVNWDMREIYFREILKARGSGIALCYQNVTVLDTTFDVILIPMYFTVA